MRAQHAGDHELRAGELLAQHAHEGNRATFAHVHRRLAEELAAGSVDRLFQPRRHRRRVPAGARLLQFQAHLRTVGCVVLQQVLQQLARQLAVQGGRQAQRQFHRGVGPQHVAGRRQRRHAVHTGDRQRGAPRAVEHQLGQVFGHRGHAGQEGELVEHRRVQHARGFLGLCETVRRNLDLQAFRQDAARLLVLQPRQQLAQQTEAGRHHAGRIAGMHAFLQHLDREIAAGQTAQRCGAPQLLVVAAAGVQADHQRRLADAIGKVVDVGRQVVAAGFLAGLDQHHAARMRHALLLQCLDGGQRAEDRIAVVGAAATIQLVALDHRHPRAQVIVPAGHLRLLVQMAVQQHGVGAGFGSCRRDFDEDQRRAAFKAHHFHLHARYRLRLRPALHQLDRLFHVPVGHPILVEHRRLVGDADVLDQLRDDVVIPFLGYVAVDFDGVHGNSGY